MPCPLTLRTGKYEANLFRKTSNHSFYDQLGPTRDLTGFFNGTGSLRFEVVGNQLKLFVNNVLQIVAYDPGAMLRNIR